MKRLPFAIRAAPETVKQHNTLNLTTENCSRDVHIHHAAAKILRLNQIWKMFTKEQVFWADK